MVKSTPEQTRGRFWKKVNKDGPIQPHCPELGPCWIWTASRYSNGYGQFWDPEHGRCEGLRQLSGAHRYSYKIHFGEIPDGLVVLHKCDNKICVNPAHLHAAPQAANMQDMKAKGRSRRGQDRWNAVFTNEQVIEIKQSASDLATRRDLAQRFGVRLNYIWAIQAGRRWKYIDSYVAQVES